MNKKCILITILIFIIIFIFPGCINSSNNNNNNNELNYCKYTIIIEPSSSEEFLVYLPLLLNDENTTSDLNDLIDIKEGKGKFEIISTEYGRCLNISSSEKIILSLELSKKEDLPNLSLSLKIEENTHSIKYYSYFILNNSIDNLNLNIKFDYKPYEGALREKQEIQEKITDNGWQIIEGYKEKVTP